MNAPESNRCTLGCWHGTQSSHLHAPGTDHYSSKTARDKTTHAEQPKTVHLIYKHYSTMMHMTQATLKQMLNILAEWKQTFEAEDQLDEFYKQTRFPQQSVCCRPTDTDMGLQQSQLFSVANCWTCWMYRGPIQGSLCGDIPQWPHLTDCCEVAYKLKCSFHEWTLFRLIACSVVLCDATLH